MSVNNYPGLNHDIFNLPINSNYFIGADPYEDSPRQYIISTGAKGRKAFDKAIFRMIPWFLNKPERIKIIKNMKL